MESLFGIPMNSIMLVLVALLGVSLASVGYVVLRSRIMFLIGLRNIPRRVAQTVLIIIGLMLSTLIISAAFTTGDTVDRSITNQTLTNLGHIDEVLQFESQEEEGDVFGAEETIPQSVVDTVEDGLVHPGSDVDGVLPLILEGVPVINPSTGLSEPLVNLVGVDGSRMGSFPDILSVDSGEQLSVSVLAADEAYVNESAAEELDAEIGDTVQTFVQNQPFSFRIVDIVKDRLLTGSL
ncbi:MAG: ABC transporter permease, partial [Dehalococcoidia bacterium]